MRPLGSDTFTIVRAALVTDSRDNSEYRDWDNATRTDIPDSNIQPFPMAEKLNFEDNRDREYSRTAIRVYAPPGTVVEPTDRIEFDGGTYDVFGAAGPWRRFSGQERYVQFIARIREG
jgi:hypothetical protein